jgi:hypothetical protein
MRLAFSVLCLAPVAVSVASAAESTGEPAVHLSWVRLPGAESCPSAGELSERVVARLGRDPFAANPTRFLEGTSAQQGGVFSAVLSVRDAEGTLLGTRELASTAASCEPLADAVALALVLTIDPNAILERPSPAAPSAPQQAPRASATPSPSLGRPLVVESTPPRQPQPERAMGEPFGAEKRENPWQAQLGARTLLAARVLPSAAWGVGWQGELYVANWRLTLDGMWFPQTRAADRRFGFGLTAGALGACHRAFASGSLSVLGCGQLMAGVVHVTVRELMPREVSDQPWVAAGLGPRLTLSVARCELALGALALVPLVQRRFLVGGLDGPVFDNDAVGALGFVSVGLRVP